MISPSYTPSLLTLLAFRRTFFLCDPLCPVGDVFGFWGVDGVDAARPSVLYVSTARRVRGSVRGLVASFDLKQPSMHRRLTICRLRCVVTCQSHIVLLEPCLTFGQNGQRQRHDRKFAKSGSGFGKTMPFSRTVVCPILQTSASLQRKGPNFGSVGWPILY